VVAAPGRRRDVIVEAATRLFAQRGYPATGIDDIGAAAGITGPGVYRHFQNKNDVLGEVVRRAVDDVVHGVTDVVGGSQSDWDVLEGLVRNMVDHVLEDQAAWAVVVREQRHLDPTSQRALGRAHRQHIEEWVHALAGARPDLTDDEVRVIVHGVLGVVAPFALRPQDGPSRRRTTELVTSSALAVLRRTAPERPR
jgi:AcrR family transcriptional regulator